MIPPETDREYVSRRAAEILAGQADARVASAADEIRDELARHAATIGSLFTMMEATVEAAGLAPAEPERPRLRLIRGEAS